MAPDDAWTPVTRAGKRAIGARAEAALAARAAATNRAVDARAEEAALSAEGLAARVAACATRVERATADVRAASRLDAAVDAVRDAAATRAREGARVAESRICDEFPLTHRDDLHSTTRRDATRARRHGAVSRWYARPDGVRARRAELQ